MKFDIVVTRHRALVDYLIQAGLITDATPVIKHVNDPELVKGKNVIGVLPFSLACLCESFTEMTANIPVHLRGVELSLEDFTKYAQQPTTYKIRKWEEEEKLQNAIDILTNFMFEADNEWDSLKDHLLNGGDPFEHDLFHACEAIGDFFSFSECVEKSADQEYKDKFKEYAKSHDLG